MLLIDFKKNRNLLDYTVTRIRESLWWIGIKIKNRHSMQDRNLYLQDIRLFAETRGVIWGQSVSKMKPKFVGKEASRCWGLVFCGRESRNTRTLHKDNRGFETRNKDESAGAKWDRAAHYLSERAEFAACSSSYRNGFKCLQGARNLCNPDDQQTKTLSRLASSRVLGE